jgi:hypothetical protein
VFYWEWDFVEKEKGADCCDFLVLDYLSDFICVRSIRQLAIRSFFRNFFLFEFPIQPLDLQLQHIDDHIFFHLFCYTGAQIPISAAHLQQPALSCEFLQILVLKEMVLVQQEDVDENAVVPKFRQTGVYVGPFVDFQVIGIRGGHFREMFQQLL